MGIEAEGGREDVKALTYERLKNITVWTVIRCGTSVEQVARDYDISQRQLCGWVKNYALSRMNPKTQAKLRRDALNTANDCLANLRNNPDAEDRASVTAQEWVERKKIRVGTDKQHSDIRTAATKLAAVS